MVLKFMESTVDSFKDKLKNPFLGTLLLVWIIRNRGFIFNLFFNENYDSEQRLTLLTEHFSGWITVLNFLLTLSISLLLLALIYVALNFSRFIVEFSERIVKPKILKLFSKTSIVSREDFNKIEEQRDHYLKKYKEERSEKLTIQRELDDFKNDSNEIIDNKIIDGGMIEEVKEENGYSRIAKSIKDDTKLSIQFEQVIGLINAGSNSEGIYSSIGKEQIDKLLQKNILVLDWNSSNQDYFYKFTDFGEKVRNYYLNFLS